MRGLRLLIAFAAAATFGCHPDRLTKINNNLEFSSPDQPAALIQSESGDVEIDFGQVGLGAIKTLTVQLVSNGAPILLGAVTPVQPDGEFSLPLIAGDSVGSAPLAVLASFAPTSLGTKTAVYALASNATGAGVVSLTLTGQGVPQGLDVTPDPIAFGNVELNQAAALTVTIANNGVSAARVAISTLAGGNPSVFALDPLPSDDLPVGGTVSFAAHFSPVQAGTASTAFTLSGCATCGAIMVALDGTGVESVLRVTPDPLHFGFVSPGVGSIESVTIANIGNQSVDLLSPGPSLTPSAASAGFAFGPPVATTPTSYPFALAAGQSAALPVSFVPPRIGFFNSSLSFGSDDIGAPSVVVPLDGYGGGAKIACLPSVVNFGATAVGEVQVESVICTNLGSDVPGHPEAALQIGAGGLTVDNPLFGAAFGSNMPGLVQDGGVSLMAGQSAEIDLTYGPVAAENDTGTLTVASNDSLTSDLGIPLTGEGVVPGACSVVATPPGLSFGEVPVGGIGQQLFEIANTGSSYCLVTDVALDSSSDPAFSLPGGALSAALLGYAGNPGGAPASLRVPVQFAPLTAESQALGKVAFSASGAPGGSISLTGSSAAACLSVSPPLFDFGGVGFDPALGKSCVSRTANFTAQNTCAVAVTVNAIGIGSGLDSTPQFALLQVPSLPLTLVPAAEFSFSGGFAPTSVGLKAGAITIATSEFASTVYQVSLLGDAEVAGSRTDTFTAQENKVDLVFVLDDDDDLLEIQAVAGELPDFLQAANAAQLDYRIALTSTDTCSAASSDQGSFEPCDHCTSSVSASPIYITPQTQNAALTLGDLFVLHQGPACGSSMTRDEQFFQALTDAFQPSLLAGHNAGFLRDDAYLAIVVINGDAEDDRSDLTAQATIGMVQGLKADPAMVSVSYIDDGLSALSMAYRMTNLVQATGGTLLDTTTQWVPGFFDLLWASERVGGFVLSTTPDPSTLLVEENGVPFAPQSSGQTIWTYDPASNAVVFSPQNLPVPGTVVAISYSISCM